MAERIGAIGDRWRHRTEAAEHAAAGFQVAKDRFARGNEIVGEHEPWTGLQRAGLKLTAQLGLPVRSDGQKIEQRDRLAVEQKRLAARCAFEHGIQEGDQALPKSPGGVVPLPVPMGMGHHEHVERRRVAGLRGWGVHGGKVPR
jgi:hypothetical protein